MYVCSLDNINKISKIHNKKMFVILADVQTLGLILDIIKFELLVNIFLRKLEDYMTHAS